MNFSDLAHVELFVSRTHEPSGITVSYVSLSGVERTVVLSGLGDPEYDDYGYAWWERYKVYCAARLDGIDLLYCLDRREESDGLVLGRLLWVDDTGAVKRVEDLGLHPDAVQGHLVNGGFYLAPWYSNGEESVLARPLTADGPGAPELLAGSVLSGNWDAEGRYWGGSARPVGMYEMPLGGRTSVFYSGPPPRSAPTLYTLEPFKEGDYTDWPAEPVMLDADGLYPIYVPAEFVSGPWWQDFVHCVELPR